MPDYREVMSIMSQCGVGAVVTDKEGRVQEANGSAARLLQIKELSEFHGKLLRDLVPELDADSRKVHYACVGFGTYLQRIPAPAAENLPEGFRMVAFKDASAEVQRRRYEHALEQMQDCVIMCDEETRITFLNDAALEMDGLSLHDVIGEPIDRVYESLDGQGLIIPRCIETRQVFRDRRQYYTTKYHKNVDITANTFPIVHNGQVLGGYSVMKDWSTVDNLNKKILELQDKLVVRQNAGKKGTKNVLTARYHFEDILHVSQVVEDLLKKCRQAARSDSSVMLYGETGTGKELFAQSIHNASSRADGPFLAINCAAIPENLLEGMLFGTEKGAFTGAETHSGLFEQAGGGTLLLDELNSMNINLQAKLLRVLQEGTMRRVGGSTLIPVDVRVISNLNILPQKAIEEHKLRQDLFYRLGVVNLTIPPLRDRKEDIPLLVKHFISRNNAKLSRNVRGLSQETWDILSRYEWPGNVRELEHVIEHAVNVLPEGESLVTWEYLPQELLEAVREKSADRSSTFYTVQMDSIQNTVKDVERSAVVRVLKENGGNVSRSARALGISRQSLQYRMRKYSIRPEEIKE
ncbi:MAG: sigma 54-interacting transcriptional regulator [Clostridium sp.]|nr:sigma 54-interacting transcriptional regulator [Clostridium sp.]